MDADKKKDVEVLRKQREQLLAEKRAKEQKLRELLKAKQQQKAPPPQQRQLPEQSSYPNGNVKGVKRTRNQSETDESNAPKRQRPKGDEASANTHNKPGITSSEQSTGGSTTTKVIGEVTEMVLAETRLNFAELKKEQQSHKMLFTQQQHQLDHLQKIVHERVEVLQQCLSLILQKLGVDPAEIPALPSSATAPATNSSTMLIADSERSESEVKESHEEDNENISNSNSFASNNNNNNNNNNDDDLKSFDINLNESIRSSLGGTANDNNTKYSEINSDNNNGRPLSNSLQEEPKREESNISATKSSTTSTPTTATPTTDVEMTSATREGEVQEGHEDFDLEKDAN